MSATNTETTVTDNTAELVYEAPKVTNHAVNQVVQGTGSGVPDSFGGAPGNLS